MTKLETRWVDFIVQLLRTEPDARIQIRKIFQHEEFCISWKDFESGLSLDCVNMGYASDKSKMAQLVRNYLNEDGLILARESLKERLASRGAKKQQSCFSVRMFNQEKKVSSMGHCIQTLTLNYIEGSFSIDMHYRTTELVQKFLADLMFLHKIVFPIVLEDLPVTPKQVNFNFSTLYISTMFMPILFQVENPYDILLTLQGKDPRFFRIVASAMRRWLVEETSYNYQTRVKAHNVFRNYVAPKLKKSDIKKIKKLIGE